MTSHRLFVLIMMLSPAGCALSPAKGHLQEESRVLGIAREAVVRDGGAVEEMDFGKPVPQADGSWRVWFSPRPAKPDGGQAMTISAGGKVTGRGPAYPAVGIR